MPRRPLSFLVLAFLGLAPLAAPLSRVIPSASAELLPSLPAARAPRYRVSDLGTLGGLESAAFALNDCGEVVGEAQTGSVDSEGEPVRRAFRWRNGRMLDLGTLGGASSWATDINNHGQVVGAAEIGRYEFSAFLWQERKGMRDISPGSRRDYDSWATAINDRGQIAGRRDDAAGEPNLFIMDGRRTHWPGRMTYSGVEDINDRGQFVGWEEGLVTFPRAVLWTVSRRRARPRSLDLSLRSDRECASQVYGINRHGEIVGDSCKGAFRLYRGRITYLGELPYDSGAQPRKINDRGHVVGTAYRPYDHDEIGRAALWIGTQAFNLSKLIPRHADWQLQDAYDINEKGQIVGVGIHGGRRRAFLLDPV